MSCELNIHTELSQSQKIENESTNCKIKTIKLLNNLKVEVGPYPEKFGKLKKFDNFGGILLFSNAVVKINLETGDEVFQITDFPKEFGEIVEYQNFSGLIIFSNGIILTQINTGEKKFSIGETIDRFGKFKKYTSPTGLLEFEKGLIIIDFMNFGKSFELIDYKAQLGEIQRYDGKNTIEFEKGLVTFNPESGKEIFRIQNSTNYRDYLETNSPTLTTNNNVTTIKALNFSNGVILINPQDGSIIFESDKIPKNMGVIKSYNTKTGLMKFSQGYIHFDIQTQEVLSYNVSAYGKDTERVRLIGDKIMFINRSNSEYTLGYVGGELQEYISSEISINEEEREELKKYGIEKIERIWNKKGDRDSFSQHIITNRRLLKDGSEESINTLQQKPIVVIFSAKEDHNGAMSVNNNVGFTENYNVLYFEASNEGDIVNALKKLRDLDINIEILSIDAHGNQNLINLGAAKGVRRTEDLFLDIGDTDISIGNYLQNSTILLNACSTASEKPNNGKHEHKNLASFLTKILNPKELIASPYSSKIWVDFDRDGNFNQTIGFF